MGLFEKSDFCKKGSKTGLKTGLKTGVKRGQSAWLRLRGVKRGSKTGLKKRPKMAKKCENGPKYVKIDFFQFYPANDRVFMTSPGPKSDFSGYNGPKRAKTGVRGG